MKKYILSFIITLVFALVIASLFKIIPKNLITTDFFVGWLSALVFIFSYNYYDKKKNSHE